jgi:ribose/xylose/arabinose/galactoside ABC-type transport system permease subunit
VSDATTSTANAIGRERLQFERFDWRLVMLLVAMAAIAILFGSLNAYYLSWQNALDLGRQASLLAVVALGAHLVIVSGEIDLSVGAVVGLISVLVPYFFDLGLPVPLVIVLALTCGALCGAVNGLITLGLRVPSFLATLGTLAVFRGLALSISNQPRVIYDDAFVAVFNTEIAAIPLTVWYPILLTVLLALLWKYSRFGVRVRAVGSNEQSARVAGLSARRIKFFVFTLASMFAAAGALILLGRTQTGLAVAGEGLELNAIAAVILGGGRLGGGKGSIVGTLLGAVLLTMVFSGIAGMGLNASWQLMTKGLILVVVIVLMRK